MLLSVATLARCRGLILDRLAAAEAERNRLTGELMQARERAAGAEGETRALRDALADLAGRLDQAAAELTEARRPWLERLLAAMRGMR